MLNILIVDDSMIIRKNLKIILTQLGHNVIGTAKNGIEAINLAKKLKPDLITMDIIMPNMGGIEAIEKIKENDENAIIVAVSANQQIEDISIALKAGAVGYIIKPFTIDKIKSEIDNIIDECNIDNKDSLNDK